MDSLLKLNKDDVVLEIGYGLGKGIYDFSKKYDCTFYGIDFSRLMYKKALKLNHENVKSGKVVLNVTTSIVMISKKIPFIAFIF